MAENKTNGTSRPNSTAMKDASVDGAAVDTAAEALAMAEEAEAEAAEAEALAAAARARARAIRLRRQARSAVPAAPAKEGDSDGQTAGGDGGAAGGDGETAGGDGEAAGGDGEAAGGDGETAGGDGEAAGGDAGADSGDLEAATATAAEAAVAPREDAKDGADGGGTDSVERLPITDLRSGADAEQRPVKEPGSAEAPRSWRRVLSRRVAAPVALGLTVVLIIGLLAVSGVMMWQHHRAAAARHRSAEFDAAARQGVVSLMTMDFNHAKDDVQHVIDNSTGQFRDDFQSRADDFIKVMKESKAVTKVTVNASAVKTMSDNTADVLVYATSEVTNAAGAQNEPRAFRLNVSMARDGGQIKMSNVELVP